MSLWGVGGGAGTVSLTLTRLSSAWYDNGSIGATFTLDPSTSKYQDITLTVNTTITLSNGVDGDEIVIRINDTSARTIAWAGNVLFSNGGAIPTSSDGATDNDIYYGTFDGTNWSMHISGRDYA